MNESHHPADAPFTEKELERLHGEDLAAAKTVVVLMVGIFCVGVVLYTIVAYAVAS